MAPFDYFVVFAEMRTGSNFLEANINMFDGLTCHGEAFNPVFIGYPDSKDILGITQADRENNPQSLIEAIKSDPDAFGGFRYFNNHDPRVLETCLADPRCAKIILTRNPTDSFVSWKIASATGQWKLTNVSHVKTEQITFDPDEFESHLEGLQTFQVHLMKSLQRSGQTAFYIAYEDLQDVDVMNGLAAFLGVPARIQNLNKKLKKQNPQPMSAKVKNFDEMAESLARLDQFNLSRTPNFEPRRGPLIPSYVAAPESGLLYLPLKSDPEKAIHAWMAGLDGKDTADLRVKFSQKTLRQWKRTHVGHRTFTVLRHPVARAHTAFCTRILSTGQGSFPEMRATLRKVHNLPIPEHEPVPETDTAYDMAAHRTAFLSWLKFLKGNLSAQTSLRVDASWASQLSVLQGMATYGIPDMILREQDLERDLAVLAAQVGKSKMPRIAAITDQFAGRLSAIYDADVEAAARDAYQRDYIAFGFGDWG